MVPSAFFILNTIFMIFKPPQSNEFDKYDEPRLHMERLMRVRLSEFDLSLRILCPLESAGIKTIGDLVKCDKRRLAQINMIGQKSISILESFVERYGLRFSMKIKGCL